MAEVYYNMGLVLHMQKKLKAAVLSYQKAIQLKSAFPEAYNNMGNAFQDQGDTKEAIGCFQKALQFKTGLCGGAL